MSREPSPITHLRSPSPGANPPPPSSEFFAFQYNAHHAFAVHHSLFNSPSTANFDVLFVQEPYTYSLNGAHHILQHPKWHLILPSAPITDPPVPPHSVIYVNSRIPSSSYHIPPSNSPNISLISFSFPSLVLPLTFINIYNPPSTFSSLPPLYDLLADPVLLPPNSPFVVLGDFNLHSPLWDLPGRLGPADDEADDLVLALTRLGASLQSQPGVTTFHNAQHHTTVVDLTFSSPAARECYTACTTSHDPDFDHGSDHYPLLHQLSLQTPPATTVQRRLWAKADWPKLAAYISENLSSWTAPSSNRLSINTAIANLTNSIKEGIEAWVPLASPSPYTKRWWSPELTTLQKQASRARRAARRFCTEDALATWSEAHKSFQRGVRQHKRQHWQDFLASLDDTTLFTASRYATKEQGPCFIPPLLRPDGTQATTPMDQSHLFCDTFFSPPQDPDLTDIHPGHAYPAHLHFHPLQITELDDQLKRMAPNKAPGMDGIPVCVLRNIWAEIKLPLYNIFKACIRIGYYPTPWRAATTLILRKPGKPDYSKPNAYRPIALLCTMGKLFEGVIAQRITFLADNHSLLPNTHLGCHPGRSTEDGIVAIEERVKHKWRHKNVVGALLIDVKNAFPTVSKPRLIHNMCK